MPLAVVKAQEATICKWLQIKEGPILLDTLSVLPSSISFKGADSISYRYDLSSGEITISTPINTADSIEVCYVQLPFPFHLEVQNRNLAIYDSSALFVDQQAQDGFLGKREELFPSQGLEKSGSITRGVSVGNTQDVFVNSALNLQLDGKLTDDINIRAVITDQNIPFQPEGNTQHVQDLDRILVEFYNDNFSVTAGDIVLHNQPSAFLRYNKQVQGGQASARYALFGNSIAETNVGVSVAKGKYASEQVEVKEGVLGPYKLRGSQNEPFVIVLANSEKVYLDGQLLERGYDHDYVIDYNQGEITFTNSVLITRYSRLKVDYEYSDRNYSRAIMSGSHTQNMGALNLFVNYYNEKDNPNRPLAFDLSDDDKQYLSQIGGHLSQGIISGADSMAYNPNMVQYKRVDTLGYTSVYVFSTHPDSAIFDVSFSDVGQGNGHYALEDAHVNGRIYRWVEPVSGVPQGRYEPIIAIPTPTQKQMFTFGGDYKLSDYEAVFSEMAVSNHDNNLFARNAAHDHMGIAYKGGIKSEGRKLPVLNDYHWKAGLGYEFNQSSFEAIDRFRTIEFDRNWNMTADSASHFDDSMVDFSAGIYDNRKNFIQYSFVHRDRGEDVKGYQQTVGIRQKMDRFLLESTMFSLDATHEATESDWKSFDGALSYVSKLFVPGYRYNLEHNRVRVMGTDSLLSSLPYLPSPLHYNAHTFFIKSNDTLKTQFNLYYTLREDEQPVMGALEGASESKTLGFLISPDFDERHDIDFSVTYRTLENSVAQNADKREETIMGRVDWYAHILNRHVRSELTYAIANAQEPKREFVFLKVPAGEGTHTWRDENNDGVQDLSEFYEAINPDERNYIKVFVPTQDYILAYSSNFNYRLNISMPRAWRNGAGLKRVLSHVSNITTWNIDKKHTDARASARFAPFVNAVAADDLLSVHENFRTTMFYNRSNPKFGMDGGLAVVERKELLTNGFNTRKDTEFHLNMRANIKRSYNLRLGGRSGRVYNASDFLVGRNYEIAYRSVHPEFEWLPMLNLRLTAQYDWEDKRNVMAEKPQETALIHALGVEGRYTKVSQRTLSLQAKYINIDFEGEENSAVGYALLNALRPGNNFTWSLNLQQRITEGLQISINYEGRKSTEQDVIHIGRMQVSALF